VGDQHQRHAQALLQIPDEPQDLSLDRHVEGGRGLVGDEDLRLAGERQRDHRPLPHPARELMRILVGPPFGIRHAHQVEGFDRPPAGRPTGDLAMLHDALGDLFADGHHGIERGERFLEDHADPIAAPILQLRPRQIPQVGSLEQDGSALDRRRRGLESQQRQGRHRLAAAGFSDDRQSLAPTDREGHVPYDEKRGTLGADRDVEIAHLQRGRSFLAGHVLRRHRVILVPGITGPRNAA
jgi:hypothetical protein